MSKQYPTSELHAEIEALKERVRRLEEQETNQIDEVSRKEPSLEYVGTTPRGWAPLHPDLDQKLLNETANKPSGRYAKEDAQLTNRLWDTNNFSRLQNPLIQPVIDLHREYPLSSLKLAEPGFFHDGQELHFRLDDGSITPFAPRYVCPSHGEGIGSSSCPKCSATVIVLLVGDKVIGTVESLSLVKVKHSNEVSGELIGVRFDRNRLIEAFGHSSYPDPKTQQKPLIIEIRSNNGASSFRVVNVWLTKNDAYNSFTNDWIISDQVEFAAERTETL
jgi:hypothetical protein